MGNAPHPPPSEDPLLQPTPRDAQQNTFDGSAAHVEDFVETAPVPIYPPAPGADETLEMTRRPPSPGQDTPLTPIPAARYDTTAPFEAVLAVPGQETTGNLPVQPRAPAGGPGTTETFGGVLPVPRDAGTPERIEPGVVLAGFAIGPELERDASAVTYSATHPQHGACVLRVLTSAAASAGGAAVLLEARLWSTLDPATPGLIAAHALGAKPHPWLAASRPTGTNLRDALAGGPLPPPRIGRVALGLAAALSLAHERRVVHGDITPEDVWLQRGDLPLLDGFARPTRWDATGARLAFPGGPPLGPAPYTAPELLLGGEPTASSDLYALGAILFEGLTGQAPAAGKAPRPPEPLPDGLPGRLFGVAARCVSPEPRDRYRSAKALEATLRHTLEQPGPRKAGARRLLLPLALLLGLVLVVLAILLATRG